MKANLVLWLSALFVATCVNAQVSLEDLQGVWRGPYQAADIPTLTEDGTETLCLDQFPQDCAKEISKGIETITINGSSIVVSFTILEGITTKAQSAKAFPSCAAAHIYPVELSGTTPPSEIQSYDPTTGILRFIDPRRPEDVNCIVATLEEGDSVPTVRFKLVVYFVGPVQRLITVGPSYRCVNADGICISESTDDDKTVLFIKLDFEIPCVEGPCLDCSHK